MYKYDLTGKVAVVTGGAIGLGNEYVETLSAQGCDVAIIDILHEKAVEEAERIAKQSGRKIKAYYGDVGEEADVIKAVSEIVKDFGQIDILVNNAGILLYGPKEDGKDPFMDYSLETWDRVMKTNITGVWLMTREVVKQSMRYVKNGKIVNIASIGGILATKAGCPSYHASKAGVIMLTASQAAELAPYGILVNSLSPGAIRNGTMGSRSAVASNDEGFKTNGCPLQRRGEYGEMSTALLMLVSDENSYINAQNIIVDGGWSMQM